MRSPGIEPGSITWQATIITTRPRTLVEIRGVGFKPEQVGDSNPHEEKKEVLPGLEPGLQGSKPWVLTNYTIEPIYSTQQK
jgi:hypothetical protein